MKRDGIGTEGDGAQPIYLPHVDSAHFDHPCYWLSEAPAQESESPATQAAKGLAPTGSDRAQQSLGDAGHVSVRRDSDEQVGHARRRAAYPRGTRVNSTHAGREHR